MLVGLYILYLSIWWFRIRRRRGPNDAKEELVKRLADGHALKVIQSIAIAFAFALVLSTGCDACANGAQANGYDGWAAVAVTWRSLIDGILWAVVVL